MVASKIGIPLAFDTYTEDMCLEHIGRNAYARILIEISVDSNWKESVAVNTWDFIANAPTCLTLPVEYSWKPSSCVHCKVFGHSEIVCAAAISSKLVIDLSPKPNPSNSEVAKDDQIAPPVNFTVVTRRNKKSYNHIDRSLPKVGPLPKSTRNGNRIGFFKPYSHPPNSGKKISVAVSGVVDPKKVASNNHITILKRPLNVSSQHTKPPSPVPSVSLKLDVNLSSLSLTLPSTSNPSRVKMSRSVYDIEPDGLNGKNRFEILNAIDESFSVLCDQDGAAFPIEPCTVGNHMIDICIHVNTNIQVAKVKSTQVQEKKSTSSSSCSQ
ncbi:hypothetical protein L2E82_37182 [Cichorium intybus]|uniref:Uncharacterized protein n=1 Tax=Cichorium intybus TaxID=13427 RepID=A0ACB9AET2_CICIN|nr:hypothetical protein L2E82_37182 [Cichorium intybus]